MEKRQLLSGIALLAGASALGYAFFAPVNDEEKIAAVLDDLDDAVSFAEPIANPFFHGTRLSGRFKDIFTEIVVIQVADIRGTIPSQRGQLGLATAQAMSRFGFFDASFGSLEIEFTDDGAKVECVVTVNAQVNGELRRDKRSASIGLVRDGGDFLITSVQVRAE